MTDEKDERERTAHYETHMDDPEEWDEPEPLPAKPRRRLASMFSVRLAPQELALVRAAAEERGLSVSAYLRMAALKEAQPPASGSTASYHGAVRRTVNPAAQASTVWLSAATSEPMEGLATTGIV